MFEPARSIRLSRTDLSKFNPGSISSICCRHYCGALFQTPLFMSSNYYSKKIVRACSINRHHSPHPSCAQKYPLRDTPSQETKVSCLPKGFAPTFSFKKFIPNCQRSGRINRLQTSFPTVSCKVTSSQSWAAWNV